VISQWFTDKVRKVQFLRENIMKFTQILALAFAALTLSSLVASEGTQALLRSGKFFKSQDKKHKKSKSSCSKESRSSKSRSKDSCDRKSIESISTDSCPKRGETLRIGIFTNAVGTPFTVLNQVTQTASGFDIQLWCQLAACLNRDFEFLAFTGATAPQDAVTALLAGGIDVIGTSVSGETWALQHSTVTNFLIALSCESLLSQSVSWDERYIPKSDLKTANQENILIKLWQIDDLVFGTTPPETKHYNNLRLAALAAGRSDEYFKAHILTAQYQMDPINYVANFGPIGSSDKYQALYVEQNTQNFSQVLQKLQICPWAPSNTKVDLSQSSIKFIALQDIVFGAFGYLFKKDCCQFIRDAQECLNALICDGTYFQICQILQEQFPAPFVTDIFCDCTPALYESFAEGTVSRHCICCTLPHKPCPRRNPCALPCNPTFKPFTTPAPAV
jgi:hypothetical protein